MSPNNVSAYIPELSKPGLGYATPHDVRLQPAWRNTLVASTGEFVGTFMFLLVAFLGHSTAVQRAGDSGQNGQASDQTLVYISLCYGFSLLINAWSMFRISGGLFNPAVTLGLVLAGKLDPLRGLIFLPVQVTAAMSAAGIVKAIIPGDIAQVQTTLAEGVSVAQGLFLEMFLTSLLVFTILMLAAEKSRATFMAPVGIGIALFTAELAGVAYTGASLNPVRSLAPCVAAADFPGYFWIYIVGPILGAILAGSYYWFVRYFNYYQANPGADGGGGSWTPLESPLMSRSAQTWSNAPSPMAEKVPSPGARGQASTSPGQSPRTPSRSRAASAGGQRAPPAQHPRRASDDGSNRRRQEAGRGRGDVPRSQSRPREHRYERARQYDEAYGIAIAPSSGRGRVSSEIRGLGLDLV